MQPLVSVITPCYNAAVSLPWAIGSMLAQTYSNWELIVVDDGSTDHSAKVVDSVSDDRVRLIRSAVNRGRPAARQTALNAARGTLLAMLDADDWVYPEKLRAQVEILHSNPKLAAVGAGMMIVDSLGRGTGVRCVGRIDGGVEIFSFSRPGRLRLAHGPVMLRMELAATVEFDHSLPRGQDSDFLARALIGQQCALLGEPLYVYNEVGAMTFEKVRTGLRGRLVKYRKYAAEGMSGSRREMLGTLGKMAVYRLANSVGAFDWLIRKRSPPPTRQELASFREAKRIVAPAAEAIMRATP